MKFVLRVRGWRLEETVMGRGLSRRQKQILDLLERAEFVRTADLRNRIAGSPQSLSRAISLLVKRGLVERVSVKFGRRTMPAVRKVNT